MSDQIKICICGGGNGAHVLAGLSSAHARTETRVLTSYQNEADVWSAKLKEGDLVLAKHSPNGRIEEINTRPAFVTKDASKAVADADVIIFCVPAFAHQQYLKAIAPYVKKNTSIIGLPGKPGFEFHCFDILKEKARLCTIMNFESLPWTCRLSEFGRKVDLLGTKDGLIGSKVSGQSHPRDDPTLLLQSVLGVKPTLSEASSCLENILMTKAIVHPPLMFGKWRDWDGEPLKEKPLFYQGISEFAASMLCSVSEEILNTARAISKARPDVTMNHVEHVENWFTRTYRHTVQNPTSLYTAMRTNSPYDGLVHPMTESSPGLWVPDFSYRYLSEDIPFGMAVTKGVAQIMGVPTPYTDQVLTWAQDHLGKEFMVGSELKGKDVKETRAPQAFGFNTLEDLLAID